MMKGLRKGFAILAAALPLLPGVALCAVASSEPEPGPRAGGDDFDTGNLRRRCAVILPADQAGDAVADAPPFAVQQVGRNDLEIVPRSVGKCTLAVALATALKPRFSELQTGDLVGIVITHEDGSYNREFAKAWQKEIARMLSNGFKMEVESLITKDISYVTEEYVPERLKAKDWLD